MPGNPFGGGINTATTILANPNPLTGFPAAGFLFCPLLDDSSCVYFGHKFKAQTRCVPFLAISAVSDRQALLVQILFQFLPSKGYQISGTAN